MNDLNDKNWNRFVEKLDSKLDSTKVELRAEFQTGLAGLRTEMHAMKAELIKWMFIFLAGFWIATLVPIAGLILQTR